MSNDDLMDQEFAVTEVDKGPDTEDVIATAIVKVDLLAAGFYHMTTRVEGAEEGQKVSAEDPMGRVSVMANLLVEVTKVVLQQQGTVENTINWVNRCNGIMPDLLAKAVEQMEANREERKAEEQETYQPDSVKLGG